MKEGWSSFQLNESHFGSNFETENIFGQLNELLVSFNFFTQKFVWKVFLLKNVFLLCRLMIKVKQQIMKEFSNFINKLIIFFNRLTRLFYEFTKFTTWKPLFLCENKIQKQQIIVIKLIYYKLTRKRKTGNVKLVAAWHF